MLQRYIAFFFFFLAKSYGFIAWPIIIGMEMSHIHIIDSCKSIKKYHCVTSVSGVMGEKSRPLTKTNKQFLNFMFIQIPRVQMRNKRAFKLTCTT